MASSPSFAVTPKIAQGALTTAETSLTTPTNTATLLTGASGGTRVSKLTACQTATASPVATQIRFYLHDGTNYKGLFAEITLTAATPSATVQASAGVLSESTNPDLLPIVLPSGWSIRAATLATGTFSASAHGADL